MMTLAQVTQQIRNGETKAATLLDDCLGRIDDPRGEGGKTFRIVSRDRATATAAAVDVLRQAEVPLPPLAGVPISVKDLFNVAGEQTLAGSRVLADQPPADRDAPVIARLQQAGAVIVGRTNMTEFAYSGLGINPHYGTPANPFDRDNRRIPGGSSSGAVISVTDGMAYAGIGSDTGGSCRIPAALCGITGYKPTQHRIPLQGTDPLSPTYDSIGAMAPTVACCALLDAIMAGEPATALPSVPARGMRLLLVENVVLDGLDEATANAFEQAVARLVDAGVAIERKRLEPLEILPELTINGGIVAAEAHARHEQLIGMHRDAYDPRVLSRIMLGSHQSAADYIQTCRLRDILRDAMTCETAAYDAMLAPTTPLTAPPMADLENEDEYGRVNKLMLRNPSLANILDRPSLSLPCHAPGTAPVGLMLTGHAGGDRRLFAVAQAVEHVLASR